MFGGTVPRGHGNDGLLTDLKRLLEEAEDLEEDFDEVIRPRPPPHRPQPTPNFFETAAREPVSITSAFAKRRGPKQHVQNQIKNSVTRNRNVPTSVITQTRVTHSSSLPRQRPTRYKSHRHML